MHENLSYLPNLGAPRRALPWTLTGRANHVDRALGLLIGSQEFNGHMAATGVRS